MNKKIIKCLLLCLLPTSISAQKVIFYYDDCGNTTLLAKRLQPMKIPDGGMSNDSCLSYKVGTYTLRINSSLNNVVSGHLSGYDGQYTIMVYDPRTNKTITKKIMNAGFGINISNLTAGVIVLNIEIDNYVIKRIKLVKR